MGLQMSEMMPPAARSATMLQLFEAFAEDPSRWVRIAAYQELGSLIATMQGLPGPSTELVPARIVRHYVSMAEDSVKSANGEFPVYCAFNFPAVLLAIGSARWSELGPTYHCLVNSPPAIPGRPSPAIRLGLTQWRVRRTLAFSLHEVARLLGPALTEAELVPTFDLFLKDLDEVRIGAITHMAEFLSLLPAAHRLTYLRMLPQVMHETEGWRFRRTVAKQLIGFCGRGLFPADVLLEHLVPLALQLCCDQVAAVRAVAHLGKPVGLTKSRTSCPSARLVPLPEWPGGHPPVGIDRPLGAFLAASD
ncbi:putative protein phosphatase 4 regulatory subunit 1 [Paratrimastix pyriformis]|uniref:Uncharacterized protein n=1 Tax=Paratrimastix pyriformis TaxID=342808 RepID=A0ABQ8UWX8_9EUKA|nr:putative protein phosphatase 4 regulatory subunit 1 [Paratrimastix pyriformis]